MGLEDWFLTAEERGNRSTLLDGRRSDRASWTTGNRVHVLIDGAEYYESLYSALRSLGHGDWVHFTDWEGDADERLCGPGTEIGVVLADLARKGVSVRGLLWRSHPRQTHFAEQANFEFTKAVDKAGGEVFLDERVRRGGSHHQKLVIARRAQRSDHDVAFVGGIDLCHGRHDDASHRGDIQVIEISPRYGRRPPWHDVQLEVRGPAISDLEHTFRERWQDPTPLDHRNPWRRAIRHLAGEPDRPAPLPPEREAPPSSGTHAVQIVRTYPAKRLPYPFAVDGERSVARAYLKAFARARCFVYIEDQYLWSIDAANALAAALRTHRGLRLVAVVPRYPDRGGRVTSAAANIGRERFINILRDAGQDRVAIFDLENEDGTPIYVHAKVCVVDDVWMVVGSDNLNRRSWTHDSEISCSVIDAALDERPPVDPGGLGDGARRLARATRLRLWREHLGRTVDDDADLIDPIAGFEALMRSADLLEQWHANGQRGARPHGRLRSHPLEHLNPALRWAARTLHSFVLDPDGRPRDLARQGRY